MSMYTIISANTHIGTVVMRDLSCSIALSSTSSLSESHPSSLSSSLLFSFTSATLSSAIFLSFINCVLLEKYDLMVATGRYSSDVKVFLNCFSACEADDFFLTFCHHCIFFREASFEFKWLQRDSNPQPLSS